MTSAPAAAPEALPRGVGPFAVAFVLLAQLVPLVGAPTLVVWPYVGPKSLALVLAAAPLATLLVAVAAATRGRIRPRSSPIVWTLVLFAASLLASTLASVDRHRSWFDDWERMLGAFHLLHVVALGLAAATLLRTDREWRVVWRGAFLVSIAVSVGGLWQKVDPEFLYGIGGFRVSSTMNHPAFLGGYATRTALLAWLLIGRERGGFRVVVAVAGLLAAATAVATETRSSLLALGVGGAAIVVGTLVTGASGVGRRLALGALLLGALGGAAVVPLLDLEEERTTLRHRVESGEASPEDRERLETLDRRWEWTGKVPGLRRFTRMSVTRKTASTRFTTWGIAVEAGLDRPSLGYGPCNYALAFERHFEPSLLAHGRQETWFDHAHSTPLDAFATRGFPGLLTQLALFLVPAFVLVRARRRGRVEARFAVAGIALLLAHLVHLSFVFDGASSWIGLVVLLAYLDRVTGRPVVAATGPARRGLAAGAILVGSAWAAVWIAPEWRTARGMQEALDRLEAGHGPAAEAAFVRSIDGDPPHADGARNMFAVGALRQIERVSGEAPPALRRILRIAFDALGRNRRLHPLDVRVVVRRAKVARELWSRFGDAAALPVVVAELLAARDLSPRRQEIAYLLAELGPAAGVGPDRLEPLLREAAEAAPEVGESWVRLAMLLDLDGRTGEAVEALGRGAAAGARFTAPERRVVEAILEKGGH